MRSSIGFFSEGRGFVQVPRQATCSAGCRDAALQQPALGTAVARMRCAAARQQQEGSRTLRIAYVTETWPPEINGVALTVERSVRYLRGRGHALTLMRPRQRGEGARDDADEWRSPGLPIPMYPALRIGLAFAASLERRFAARAPQLVHVATQGPLG